MFKIKTRPVSLDKAFEYFQHSGKLKYMRGYVFNVMRSVSDVIALAMSRILKENFVEKASHMLNWFSGSVISANLIEACDITFL